MASDRLRANRAPPTAADPPTPDDRTPVDHANATRGRLDRLLDRRIALGRAQGVLSEIARCTPSRAGEVLLHVGAQLGFQSAEDVAEFFLACATADDACPYTLAFTRRAATVAPDTGAAAGFATVIVGARRLVVRGELDIATVPPLATAFADHPPAPAPGDIMVLDLHDMTFVDITGVRALSEIHAQAADLGYQLRVHPPSEGFPLRTLQYAVRARWLPPLFADVAPWLR
jgi:ABC-type transporter Mla MlaB component